MSWLTTEKALIQQVNNAALGVDVIIENQTFDKSSKGSFIEAYNIPSDTDRLDKSLSSRYNGIFQLSAYVEVDQGKSSLLELTDGIVDAYLVNELPELDGCTVAIESTSPGAAIKDGEYYRSDISISYFVLNSKV